MNVDIFTCTQFESSRGHVKNTYNNKKLFYMKGGGGAKEHVYSTLHRHYGIAKLKITHFKCACAIP